MGDASKLPSKSALWILSFAQHQETRDPKWTCDRSCARNVILLAGGAIASFTSYWMAQVHLCRVARRNARGSLTKHVRNRKRPYIEEQKGRQMQKEAMSCEVYVKYILFQVHSTSATSRTFYKTFSKNRLIRERVCGIV